MKIDSPTQSSKPLHHLSRFQSLLVLVLMIVAMSCLSDRFLTSANGLNIMRQISVNVCLSIGMTLVIVSGGIDLSVGSILALAGAVTAGLIKYPIALQWLGVEVQFTTWGAIVVGLAIGILLGCFNGQMITRLKIPSFVATLGMLSIARGMTMLLTKGFPITGLGDGFAVLGTKSWLGVPAPVWIAGSLIVVFIIFTKKTRIGRHIYAIGGNETTARFSGLNVNRIKVLQGIKIDTHILVGCLFERFPIFEAFEIEDNIRDRFDCFHLELCIGLYATGGKAVSQRLHRLTGLERWCMMIRPVVVQMT